MRKRKPIRGFLLTFLLWLPLGILKLLVKLEGFLFLNAVKGQKTLADTAVSFPVSVKSSFLTTRDELRDAESRRKLRMAFFNERLWTPERRRALLFVFATAAVVSYFLSEILLRVLQPDDLPYKRETDIIILYAAATRLFLPTPFEPILNFGVTILGLPVAVLAAAIGATLGSYLLFLIGSQVNEGLHALTKDKPKLRRPLEWLENNGRKHAYWILGVLLSIPLAPDSLAIIGALLRLRLGGFLLTIFLSTLIRGTVYLLVFPLIF